MGGQSGGTMGSETGAGMMKQLNPQTQQMSQALRAQMAAAPAQAGGPGPGAPMPPPGGWGTAGAGVPPGGYSPMGGAPSPGWLQQMIQQQGGIKPAGPMPAQRQIQQPTQTQPGQTVQGGGAPMAGNFFGTGQVPAGFGDARPAQGAGGRRQPGQWLQQQKNRSFGASRNSGGR